MKKIRKGDNVIVITGKDKGKQGVVLSVSGDNLIIEGINLAKKHIKANPNTGDRGGIVSKAMPIRLSNVMMLDPNTKKASRVGIRTLEDGQRVRYFKASGQLIEVKE